MIWPSPESRRRAYCVELEALAQRAGWTPEVAQAFVQALPYSVIPTPADAHMVLDFLAEHPPQIEGGS